MGTKKIGLLPFTKWTFEPEGVWRYKLVSIEGQEDEVRCKATYNQVVTESKLVYTDTFVDGDWNVVEDSQMHTTVTFEDVSGGTRLIITTQFASTEALESAERLAKHFTVYNYDRRGRGESTNTSPYTVKREVEDIEVLIQEAGGHLLIWKFLWCGISS